MTAAFRGAGAVCPIITRAVGAQESEPMSTERTSVSRPRLLVGDVEVAKLRLECLKITAGQSNFPATPESLISYAEVLFAYVTGAAPAEG